MPMPELHTAPALSRLRGIFSQSVSLTLYVVLSAYNNPLQNPNNNPLLNPNNNPLLFQLAQGEIELPITTPSPNEGKIKGC